MIGGPPSRRDLLKAGLLGGTALAAAGCGFVRPPETAAAAAAAKPIDVKIDGDLVYFNWADYIDPDVKKGFSQEYGVKFIESNFDSMESMTAKLAAGNTYDVIFPSDKFAQRLISAGQLRTIDHSKLKNAESIFATYTYFENPWYDRRSAHTVPNTMYKTGIGWRKDKLGERLSHSWADLWDQRASGHTFLLDDRDEVLGLGALRLGYDINTAESRQLAEIVKLIKQLRPRLRAFSSDDTHNLSGGDSWLQQMWSGDVVSVVGQAKDPSIYGFESPREGAPTGNDCYAIPANAKHPGTAMLFIDYMLRPENVKKNIEYIGYAMPVRGTEATFAKLAESVPEAVVTVADLAKAIDFRGGGKQQVQARDAAFTEIKAG